MIRWGILGCGAIAAKFAQALRAVSGAELRSVASRDESKAREFANSYGAKKCHLGYEGLASDPDVDVVYVATPHSFHKAHTVLCLNAGKHVLCEKPFAINRQEAQEMVEIAMRKELFLMEAMWTRFLPVTCKVREWLANGIVGDVRMITADFGFRADFDPHSRLFDLNLGGGSLLDVGVYTVAMASMVYKRKPSKIQTASHLGRTGVDEQAAAILQYDRGELALLASAISVETANEARICGTAGTIHIPQFWRATTATFIADKKKEIAFPFRANGFEYEIEEVLRCIEKGKTESDIMPISESLSIMETMDAIRAQWGFMYPTEKSS